MQGPDKDIGRDICAKVSYMAFTICIWQSAGDQDGLISREI